MVRALTKDEQDQLDQMFGGSGTYGSSGAGSVAGSAGLMGGQPKGGVNTQDGRFTGEQDGTGFVNAQQYLDANKDKGVDLGKAATAEVDSYATGLSSDVDNANKLDIENMDLKKYYDLKSDAYQQDHDEIWKPGRAGPDSLPKTPNSWNAATSSGGGGGGGGGHTRQQKQALVDTSELNNFDAREKAWNDFNDFRNSKAAHYDEKRGESTLKDLISRQESILGKKSAGDSWKTSLSDTDGGRTARKGLLADYAKKQGISGYGDAAREFDAMFMEADSPNIIKDRLSSLNSAYNKAFDGSFDKSIQDKQAKHKANIDFTNEIQGDDAIQEVLDGFGRVQADRDAYDKEIAAKRKAQKEQEAKEKSYREKKAREASGGGPAGKGRTPGAAEAITSEFGGIIGRGAGTAIDAIIPGVGAADAGEKIGEKAGEVGKAVDNTVSTGKKALDDTAAEVNRAGNKIKKVLSDERAKKNVKGAKSSEFDRFMKSISIGKR